MIIDKNLFLLNNVERLENDEIQIIENKHFIFINFKKIKTPSQGWKIHVSAFFDNYFIILELVYKYCLNNKISFKCIKGKNNFYINISNIEDPLKSGKFITIYPKNLKEFKKTLNDLNFILRNQKGPRVLTDLRYKDSKVLYYRYGIIGSNKKMLKFGNNKTNDLKMPFFVLPPQVVDPFGYKKNKLENNLILNKKYLILKIIDFSNSGAIFLCCDEKEKNKLYVIKEAR